MALRKVDHSKVSPKKPQLEEPLALSNTLDKRISPIHQLRQNESDRKLDSRNNSMKRTIDQKSTTALQTEILVIKEQLYQCEMELRLKQQDNQEQKQRSDQFQVLNVQLEREIKNMKQDHEKVLKEVADVRKKAQILTDNNIQLQTELDQAKTEIERVSNRKAQDHNKYKEALESLKNKSNSKIKELKDRLKETQVNQQQQQEEMDELRDQIKESESQLSDLQNTHKHVIKSLEAQYRKQMDQLESSLISEQRQAEQNILKSNEQIIEEKQSYILDLQKEIRSIKDQLLQTQLESDKKYKQILFLEEQSLRSENECDQLINEIEQLNSQLHDCQVALKSKDDHITKLLSEIDEIRQFSEQTLQSLKENDDYISEIEREKSMQQEIIQNIQSQLQIEMQGSFSYQRLGQELEQRCKLYKESHDLLMEENVQKEAIFEQQVSAKDELISQLQQQLKDEQVNYNNQYNHLKKEFQSQQTALESNVSNLDKQIDNLTNNNDNLKTDQENNIQTIKKLQKQLDDTIQKDKANTEDNTKKIQFLANEKHLLQLQLDEAKFKFRALQQRSKRNINRQRETLQQLLSDTKNTFMNKLQLIQSDTAAMIISLQKKFSNVYETKFQQLEIQNKQDKDLTLYHHERQVDELKQQAKKQEQNVQQDLEHKLAQKQQQIDKILNDKSANLLIDDLKSQLHKFLKDNESLQQQLTYADGELRTLKQQSSNEIMSLNRLIKEQQEELLSQQQFQEYTLEKERQYFDQKYIDLKQQADRKLEILQQDYDQQILKLESLLSPEQYQSDRSSTKFMHRNNLSNSHKSPFANSQLQTNQSTFTSNLVSTRQNQYSSPQLLQSTSIRTPHKSPTNFETSADKTIEELRSEIQLQKQKLSKMKSTFTESQKKQFTRY